MTWEAWYAIGTICLVIATLGWGRMNIDTVMVGGLTLLLLADAIVGGGILGLDDGLQGFAHKAVIMIAAMFVVAAGLQETGGIEMIAGRLLGRPRTVAGAQARMMVPVAIMSAFMNNTPIVAMYLPIIGDWARKLRISPSKLFMPLSFSAILGGKISLIGTASNIVVISLYWTFLHDEKALEVAGDAEPWLTALNVEPLSATMQFWGVGLLGVPTTIIGIAIIVVLSRWLLPEREPIARSIVEARKYQVDMVVQPDSPVVGKSIEDAGLRHLPGLYLMQIERDGNSLPAVSPQERLEANDRLGFVGVLESVVDLRKIRGLAPATDQVEKIASGRRLRTLAEAVVAHNSPIVGRSVRAIQFRTKYNAAIVAVHRRGHRIAAKIGDIVLQAGDVLLLDTHTGFVAAFRNSDDFHLVSQVAGSRPIRHERAWVALMILGVLVGLLTLSPLPPTIVALVAAGLMVGTRCITGTEARTAVNWQVLLVIGSAIGMGKSLEVTGAADFLATGLLSVFHDAGPQVILLIGFVLTTLVAQVVTNNGAAVLLFPILMETARSLGVRPEPFVFMLMIAAGSTYLSPVSYQTNLMVYGAGGYRFLDFARLGLPLTIVLAIVCAVLAPIFFPFYNT